MKKENLKQIQSVFMGLVMRPLTPAYRLAPLPAKGRISQAALSRIVKPGTQLSENERLELYARQYWFRLIDSFMEDFPGVAAIMGEKLFHRAMLAYLHKHPSRSYTLRNLGRLFPQFLYRWPELPKRIAPAALDMARLEWAQMEIFDAADLPPATPDQIASAKLTLQPHIRLLQLDYPVDEWLVKGNRDEFREEASNAMLDTRKKAARSSRRISFRKQSIHLAMHRHKERIFFKRIEPEAYTLLEMLQQGARLNLCMKKLLTSGERPPDWWNKKIGEWFADWTSIGWIVAAPIKSATKTRKP